jgi:hypothetical protein
MVFSPELPSRISCHCRLIREFVVVGRPNRLGIRAVLVARSSTRVPGRLEPLETLTPRPTVSVPGREARLCGRWSPKRRAASARDVPGLAWQDLDRLRGALSSPSTRERRNYCGAAGQSLEILKQGCPYGWRQRSVCGWRWSGRQDHRPCTAST